MKIIPFHSLLSETTGRSPVEAVCDSPVYVDVPVLGTISAGASSYGRQEEDGCIRVDLDSIGLPKGTRIFALRVRGNSMNGASIFSDDIIILEFKPAWDGAVVAALVDGETTLKRYIMRGGRPFLKAENPRFKDIIPAQELVIQGVMVALVRNT